MKFTAEEAQEMMGNMTIFMNPESPDKAFRIKEINGSEAVVQILPLEDNMQLMIVIDKRKEPNTERWLTTTFENMIVNGDMVPVGKQEIDPSAPDAFAQIGEAILSRLKHLDECEATLCGILQLQQADELLRLAVSLHKHKTMDGDPLSRLMKEVHKIVSKPSDN